MNKKVRPKRVEGVTYRKATGCGTLYVTIGRTEEGLIEVFVGLGSAGGCTRCQNEALARAVSLGLKYGIPPEEFIDELQGLVCPNNRRYPEEEECLSCPDGLAKALKESLNGQKPS